MNAVVFILNEMEHRCVHNQEVAIFKSARSGLKLSDNCEGRDGHHFIVTEMQFPVAIVLCEKQATNFTVSHVDNVVESGTTPSK